MTELLSHVNNALKFVNTLLGKTKTKTHNYLDMPVQRIKQVMDKIAMKRVQKYAKIYGKQIRYSLNNICKFDIAYLGNKYKIVVRNRISKISKTKKKSNR